MTTWSTRVIRTSLVTFIVLFATFGDASVTWRRVTKSTSKPQTQLSASTYVTKHTTKSPITWKRSTIVRRSTDDAENIANEDESDELSEASSERDEDLKELENDSGVKPLVPGSRPGFWFDSSRRKKPASLLRPGERRNSLFPTRASTTTEPTTVSATPVTALPRTPPPVLDSIAKNISTKIVGRNTSTRSPIAFRRWVKTTRTPKISSTTESLDIEINKEENLLLEKDEKSEDDREEDVSSKESTNSESENVVFKRPNFSSRRRYYNGTRLSWIKQNSLRNSRTTATPQQLTTVSPTEDFEKLSRKTTKFPRTRSRIRASTPQDTLSRTKQTTVKPTTSTITTKTTSEEITTSRSTILRTRNNPNMRNDIPKLRTEDKSDFVEETTPSPENYDGSRQSTPEERKPKVRTTHEPFFLTKEYGRIVTAIPEVTQNMEDIKPVPTVASSLKKNKDHSVPAIRNEKERISSALPKLRKGNKRTRTRVTEAPKLVTTPITEEPRNTEKEYEYENDDFDSSVEYIDDFKWKHRTTEKPKSSTSAYERISEKIRGTKTTSTIRPMTFPSLPAIDPNNNAYVVWSVGHGGSGWSYQKHGGKVQWSAINSEAEGDNWSVVTSDERENFDRNLNYQWNPISNMAPKPQKSEKVVSAIKDELMHSMKKKADAYQNASPVTYIPKLPFKNETVLNFNKITNSKRLSNEVASTSPSPITTSSVYTSSQPIDSTSSTSVSNSLQQTQHQKVAGYVSQTPLPTLPTQEDKFDFQTEGLLNEYPSGPEYPYLAEIRETNNLPTASTSAPQTTKLFLQEYVTETAGTKQENELSTLSPISQGQQQLFQAPEKNSYPTILPTIESVSPYISFPGDSSDKETSFNKQFPAVKAPPQSYQSAIPLELAKSVVKQKKWHVVGTGGDDGWSLLNEDGVLEWKIHNVDGHWRVSSADQLQNMQFPILQKDPYIVDDQESQTGNYEPNYNGEQYPPKVWTLEDDYEKWRAVSAERGIPVGESFPETTTSSQEYDYDNADYNGEYYSNDDDYYSSGPVNADLPSYEQNEDYGSRPFWGSEETQMTDSHSKEDYPQFGPNIEEANSREDAIAAWKSLLAQHGSWKLPEKFNTYLSQKPGNFQERVTTVKQKTSTPTPRHEIDRNNQNREHQTNSEKYEHFISRYQNYGINRQREKQDLMRENENAGSYKNKLQEPIKEKNEYLQGRSDHTYNQNNALKETKLPTLNVKLYEAKYEAVPESTEQISGFHNPEDVKQENGRKQEQMNNQHEREFRGMTISKNDNRPIGNYFRVRNEKFISERKNKQENRDPERFQHNTRNQEMPKDINSQQNNGILPEAGIHARGKDHSKLQSLINKLEAIQKESNGRAVIDLTALLKQIKERRNMSSNASFPSNISNIKPEHKSIVDSRILSTLGNLRDSNTESQPVRPAKTPKDVNFEPNEKLLDFAYGKIRPQNEYNSNKENEYRSNKENEGANIKPSNHHRLRHLNQSNRKRNPAIRLDSPNAGILSNNQTNSRKNERTQSITRTKEWHNSERQNTQERPQKRSQQMQRFPGRKYPSRSRSPDSKQKSEVSDSSSSEEIIVDLRDDKKNKSPVSTGRQRRPTRKQTRRPNYPKPIVMKAETEIEDGENGSKKNRKIIVIDYASTQKHKSSIDKKDLELIIRNVKHRRSEMYEGNKE